MNRIMILAMCWIACNDSKPVHQHIGSDRGDYADSVNSGLIATDTMKGSPERIAMNNIGKCHVHIEYSSPGVKGRVIWGGLVPYGQVWVTGAHAATTINFSKDVLIRDRPVKAGIYAFFTIPGKERWTVILNKRFDQHLADDYNEKEDIARFEVMPAHNKELVERLTYEVTGKEVVMKWEHVQINLPIQAP